MGLERLDDHMSKYILLVLTCMQHWQPEYPILPHIIEKKTQKQIEKMLLIYLEI